MKFFRLHRPSFNPKAAPDWVKSLISGGSFYLFKEGEEASAIAGYYKDPNLDIEVCANWGDYITLEGGAIKIRPGDWVEIDDTTLLPPELT